MLRGGFPADGSFNPRAPRGARPQVVSLMSPSWTVSIHAPRAGRDDRADHGGRALNVSIHAPRAGRDGPLPSRKASRYCFNPRAPRGARPRRWSTCAPWDMVSIHAPRAGRDAGRIRQGLRWYVSIHAPRAGRDQMNWCAHVSERAFQSTRPARGATRHNQDVRRLEIRFNPRAPRGARRITRAYITRGDMFQSTRPARGATAPSGREPIRPIVSIHAPRAGRDDGGDGVGCADGVSIHAPRAGRDAA